MARVRRLRRSHKSLDAAGQRPRQIPKALICAVANLLFALGGVALAVVAHNASAGLLLTVVAIPPLFVLTLYFAVRDLCGQDALRTERRAAWLALTLSSIPLGLLVGLAYSLSRRLPSALG